MATKKIQILGGVPQGDWQQYDETAVDYIKNRPFYDDRHTEVVEVVLESWTSEEFDNYKVTGYWPTCQLIPGQLYNVTWCGELYSELVCYVDTTDQCNTLGGTQYNYPFGFKTDSDNDVGLSYNKDSYPTWEISVALVEKHGELRQIDEKYLPEIEIPEQVVSDWNQDDVNAPDYIKNRTHYETFVESAVWCDKIVAVSSSGKIDRTLRRSVQEGQMFVIIIGEQQYRCTIQTIDGVKTIVWRGASADCFYLESNGRTSGKLPTITADTRFKIAQVEQSVQPLDEKYIPDTIARTHDIPAVYAQPDEPTDAPDGTLWVDTDEEIGEALTLDTTLSIEGMAADAKAVGDALSGKLNTESLATAINEALAEAKESGMFDGEDGDGAGYPLAEPATELEPARYYVFGEVSELSVTLIQPDDGYAREHCFEFIPTEDFAGLTVTPEPRWVVEPQFVAGEICQVSILRGVGVITSA